VSNTLRFWFWLLPFAILAGTLTGCLVSGKAVGIIGLAGMFAIGALLPATIADFLVAVITGEE